MRKVVKKTYVTCNLCESWDPETKITNLCKYCNNSTIVVDPATIVCNMCGSSLCPAGTHNAQIPHGLYNAKVTGGYDSYHLFDMTTYTFSFCEKCLREMFNKCSVKPSLSDYHFNDDDDDDDVKDEEEEEEEEEIDEATVAKEVKSPYDMDQEAYDYRVWKDQGGARQSYVKGLCNSVKDCSNKAVYTRVTNNADFSEECACEEHKEEFMYYNSKLIPFIPDKLKAFI